MMNVCKEDNTLPRNKYPEETVEKILDASLKLFFEKGYEQTTVLDIVNNLGGLTRGAFYHHFKSKEEVLYAIFKKDDNLINSIFEKVRNAQVSNGLERLKYALKLSRGAGLENESRFNVMSVSHSLLSSPRFLSEHIKDTHVAVKFIQPIIEEGMADGSIKQGNPKIIAELLMLLSNIWLLPNIFPNDSKDEMAEKINIIGDIFKGLGCDFLDDEICDNAIESINKLKI